MDKRPYSGDSKTMPRTVVVGTVSVVLFGGQRYSYHACRLIMCGKMIEVNTGNGIVAAFHESTVERAEVLPEWGWQ